MKMITPITALVVSNMVCFSAVASDTAGAPLAAAPPRPREYVVVNVGPYLVDCIDKVEHEPTGRKLQIEGSLLTVKDPGNPEIGEVYVPPSSHFRVGERLHKVRLQYAKQFYYGVECSDDEPPKALDSKKLIYPDRLRKNTDYFATDAELKQSGWVKLPGS